MGSDKASDEVLQPDNNLTNNSKDSSGEDLNPFPV